MMVYKYINDNKDNIHNLSNTNIDCSNKKTNW